MELSLGEKNYDVKHHFNPSHHTMSLCLDDKRRTAALACGQKLVYQSLCNTILHMLLHCTKNDIV